MVLFKIASCSCLFGLYGIFLGSCLHCSYYSILILVQYCHGSIEKHYPPYRRRRADICLLACNIDTEDAMRRLLNKVRKCQEVIY
ncbi:hypothetical protein V1507DRAFT_450525 [Lipomyces tetrasporus]